MGAQPNHEYWFRAADCRFDHAVSSESLADSDLGHVRASAFRHSERLEQNEALREAQEEIGLPRDLPRVLGTLPSHETVTAFTVTPVVAVIERAFDIRPEPGEVEEVFSVPLAHLMRPEHYSVQSRRWRGQRRHYFTVPFGPYYIWGATARMLRGLAERMQP